MIYKTELENSRSKQLRVGNVNLSFISDQNYDAPWAKESEDGIDLKIFSKNSQQNGNGALILNVSKL